jgi:hypothetical protein
VISVEKQAKLKEILNMDPALIVAETLESVAKEIRTVVQKCEGTDTELFISPSRFDELCALMKQQIARRTLARALAEKLIKSLGSTFEEAIERVNSSSTEGQAMKASMDSLLDKEL